ncbi:Os01g0391100, partial [Oryza sativa Japonica Group]
IPTPPPPHSFPNRRTSTLRRSSIPSRSIAPPQRQIHRRLIGAESEGIVAPPLPISRRATAPSISARPPPISQRQQSPGPRRHAQLSLKRAPSHRSPPPLSISRRAVEAIFTDAGSIEAQPLLTDSVARR